MRNRLRVQGPKSKVQSYIAQLWTLDFGPWTLLLGLLVLGAGFGSVLMLSGTWQVGKQTRVASSETRVASNQNHSLLATHTAPGDARSVPTMPRAIASKPTFAATETRIVLMDSVLSPRSSTLPAY